tara:strand:- start:146 stop:1117 length:972 start_codon:yes stop_codon:yes gene_type:complete
MSTFCLNSIGELENFLKELWDLDESKIPSKLCFGGDLEYLKIKIEGPKYHGSMPAETLKGLYEYQQSLYRVAAFALKGSEFTSIRKLTKHEISELSLVYEFSDGSIDIKAQAEKFLGKIAEGFNSMDSKDKLAAICIVALCAVGGYAADLYFSSLEATTKAKITAQVEQEKEQAETERLKIFADAVTKTNTQTILQISQEGTQSLLKSTPSATKAIISGITFDESAIAEINSRSSSSTSEAELWEEEFIVGTADFRTNGIIKYSLSRASDGIEFKVLIDESEFEPEDLQKLLEHAKSRTKVKLLINATVKSEQVIKAQLIEIH